MNSGSLGWLQQRSSWSPMRHAAAGGQLIMRFSRSIEGSPQAGSEEWHLTLY